MTADVYCSPILYQYRLLWLKSNFRASSVTKSVRNHLEHLVVMCSVMGVLHNGYGTERKGVVRMIGGRWRKQIWFRVVLLSLELMSDLRFWLLLGT